MYKDILTQVGAELDNFSRKDQVEILKFYIQERLTNNLQNYLADLTSTSNRLIKSQSLIRTNRTLNR